MLCLSRTHHMIKTVIRPELGSSEIIRRQLPGKLERIPAAVRHFCYRLQWVKCITSSERSIYTATSATPEGSIGCTEKPHKQPSTRSGRQYVCLKTTM